MSATITRVLDGRDDFTPGETLVFELETTLAECFRCGHTIFTPERVGMKCTESGCDGTYVRSSER